MVEHLCVHCRKTPGMIRFLGQPGIFCLRCALEVNRQFYTGGADHTWPELVADLLPDKTGNN